MGFGASTFNIQIDKIMGVCTIHRKKRDHEPSNTANQKMLTLLICRSLVTAHRSLSSPLAPSNALIRDAWPSSVLEFERKLSKFNSRI